MTAPASLAQRSWAGRAKFMAVLAVLIFLPAWTVDYWQGWALIANFTLCSALSSLYFLKHDPALVERRLSVGPRAEQRSQQKWIQAATSLLILALVVVSALDHRFGWSVIGWWGVLIGHVLIVLGYVLIFVVFRANSFAAATVRVVSEQRVVSSGPYAVMRHPMYGAAIILFAGVPPALGSAWGLLLVPLLALALGIRAVDEERYLVTALAGYADYRARVRWRIVPGLW